MRDSGGHPGADNQRHHPRSDLQGHAGSESRVSRASSRRAATISRQSTNRATLGLPGDGGGDLAVPDPRSPAQPTQPGELGQDIGDEGVVEVGTADQLHHDTNRDPGARVSMSYRLTGEPDPPDSTSGSTVVPA
ncbi:hypothetical protein [Rhodococcus sp. USK10]|uniref:hypothetical protein n=1 Tax=Rhodococcus sp. USK10 TaxID=2789739 RepID=UPI002151FA21|nr:hypothetical protein [Rhodococcus sp. USK10]